MTQSPDYLGGPSQDPYTPYPPMPGAGDVRTSGLAIASLVCGLLGLLGCCTFVPSLLAVVFGASAYGATKRGEARGGGMAISGIVLGAAGLVLGIVLWLVVILSPEPTVMKGETVSAGDREKLQSAGVIEADETIELLYATGIFSLSEGCVVLTDRRLVNYLGDSDYGDPIESYPYETISVIDYTPAENWLGEGMFMIESDEDEDALTVFAIDGMDRGDDLFHRTLTKNVNKARANAGKPPVRTDSGDADLFDETD